MYKENHDSSLFFIQCTTCESGFGDVPVTVVFNSLKHITTVLFLKTIDAEFFSDSGINVLFLKKQQEATELSIKNFVVSSAIDKFRNRPPCFENCETDEIERAQKTNPFISGDLPK